MCGAQICILPFIVNAYLFKKVYKFVVSFIGIGQGPSVTMGCNYIENYTATTDHNTINLVMGFISDI